MIDLVITFRQGTLPIDPDVNNTKGFFAKIIYAKCGCCGKLAEQELLAHGPGVCAMLYACGCTSHSEEGKETVWTRNY